MFYNLNHQSIPIAMFIDIGTLKLYLDFALGIPVTQHT